jgi:hypothetical protein
MPHSHLSLPKGVSLKTRQITAIRNFLVQYFWHGLRFLISMQLCFLRSLFDVIARASEGFETGPTNPGHILRREDE